MKPDSVDPIIAEVLLALTMVGSMEAMAKAKPSPGRGESWAM